MPRTHKQNHSKNTYDVYVLLVFHYTHHAFIISDIRHFNCKTSNTLLYQNPKLTTTHQTYVYVL